MDTALGRLHALLPQVALKPKNGVLWAYPSPEPEKPTLKESRPLILVAGACFALFLRFGIVSD